ncbi:urease accessory protein [Nocardia neocaledoniensis]|uniref:Urease accessory protein n=2 Tax=Nocardia neocaledoniensis TaxID=236511 RepID=A0A317N598_9NOCA|nr:urease accessory UreF family protein [Nocardia neocaledoniensis]PWV69837.1 urease accessory protein [Nocardia neocaledoniensis]
MTGLVGLLLADGRLPTGGHAHSAGLEPALRAGLAPELIPRYLEARLHTVGRVEAATAVLARRVAAGSSAVTLDEIEIAYAARTSSAALRAASAQLGRGTARLAGRLWPEDPAIRALTELRAPCRPVAFGVVAAVAGLDACQTARTVLYDDLQTAACAAPKLLPVDPVEPVLDLAETVDRLAGLDLAVTDPADLPAYTAPLIEQWSLEHANRQRRIFYA